MMQSRLWISAGIIAVVIIIGFVLSVPHTKEVPPPASRASTTPEPAQVVVKDSYKKGVHTISGSVMAPNACASVTADATLEGDSSAPRGIALSLGMPADTGICLEVPTKIPFGTTIAAPSGLPITTTINGVIASTTTP